MALLEWKIFSMLDDIIHDKYSLYSSQGERQWKLQEKLKHTNIKYEHVIIIFMQICWHELH